MTRCSGAEEKYRKTVLMIVSRDFTMFEHVRSGQCKVVPERMLIDERNKKIQDIIIVQIGALSFTRKDKVLVVHVHSRMMISWIFF